ncbi:MAG: PQQ-binding-like beta-propeller repeat protein [Candidatus Sumerlaeota bacterium]|nr:PQQ-binding-like beta-propeller repeat protein [Candidatus Sumerlaeota bacterium]
MKRIALLTVLVAARASGALAADWPQLLGPDRNGSSPETGLARAWPAAGPTVVWTVPLGEGYGGPVIREGKVYILDRVNDQQDVMRALDAATGKELWSFAYDAPGTLNHNGSRSVPAVDEQNVYAAGPFGDFHCISLTTHQPVWKTNLYQQFNVKRPTWGSTQCPLLYKNMVIIAVQGPDAGVVAFERASGNVLWKSPPLPGRTSYVSPKVMALDGVDQVTMISSGPEVPTGGGGASNGASKGGGVGASTNPGVGAKKAEVVGTVAGMDPSNGKILWTYPGFQCANAVSNVLPIGDGRLFITGNYKAGSVMLKVEKKDGAFAVTEPWRSSEMECHVHPPVLCNGYLYANSQAHHDGLECLSLEGNVMWRTQNAPFCNRGAVLLADGLLFNLDSDHGTLYLSQADPSGYKQLAWANLLETDECLSALALSDGHLFIRDKKQMKCLDVKGPYPGAVVNTSIPKQAAPSPEETSDTLVQKPAAPSTQAAGNKKQSVATNLDWRDALFKKMDTNGDGFLSLDEHKAGFPGVAADDAKQVFDLKDKNKDGKLSSDEFKPILFEELAVKYDKNKDGKLTLEEMKKGMKNPTAAENTFKDRDKNGDGVITKEDFQQAAGSKQNGQAAQARKPVQAEGKNGPNGKTSPKASVPKGKASSQAAGINASSAAGNALSGYVLNGDFARDNQNWVFHTNTKNVVTFTDDVPPGVTGRSLRYSKSPGIPDEDYHINHTMTVPAPGSYTLSFWCKTTAPLIPLVVVRKNWVKADLDPAKVFAVHNDGAWKRYEVEFQIDESWPLTFVLVLYPGVKGELGVGYSGETLFADVRCAPKPLVLEQTTDKGK